MPLVTVVIPTVLKRTDYLKLAVESFEKQIGDHELIIVIDGVDGEVPTWATQYVVKKSTNEGTPAAMNYGFKLASGKYVTTIGDDDILYGPESLEVRARNLEARDADFIYSDAYEIDAAGGISKNYERGKATKSTIWRSDCINLHTLMWRKELFDRVGYLDEDLKFDEDWAWKIRLVNEAEGTYLKMVTACTRYHASNKTFGEGRAGVLRDHKTMKERLALKYGIKNDD